MTVEIGTEYLPNSKTARLKDITILITDTKRYGVMVNRPTPDIKWIGVVGSDVNTYS
jgi:hypothetical protein